MAQVADDARNGKKISKEIRRQLRKDGKVHDPTSVVENVKSTIGASPADDFIGCFSYEDPMTMWRKKEWNDYNDFCKLLRKYEQTYIPMEKARYEQTLLRTHGTLNETERIISLTVEMLADPRIDIRTHRGVIIQTTVASQNQYVGERANISESSIPKR